MCLENYNAEELSDELIFQIKNIVDGNQASADEIKKHAYQAQEISASLYIQWRFCADIEKTRVAGGRIADTHFGYDSADFKKTCQALCDKASYDVALRQDFLAHQQQIERQALIAAEYEHTFHDFGKFSVHESCATCRGKGKVTCGSCGGRGRKGCGGCGGSGRQSRQEAQYRNGQYAGSRTIYHSCYGCGGSGSRTCGGCAGSGRVRCGNCGGHGFFTLTHHITAVAKPSYSVSVSTDHEEEALTGLLRKKGTKFCGEKIPFELVGDESNGNDTHLFSYEGETVVLAQAFSLRDKKYHCCAFSNPPYPYVRPTIFDDLFADELTYLQENVPKKGKVRKKTAITFFNRYAGQPVLDEAMRTIAKVRTETQEGTGSAVFSACHGFISQEMSETLAGYLNSVMDKVSPTYSGCLWWVIGILSALFTLPFVEYELESKILSHPISSVFSTSLVTASILLIAIVIAFILSAIYVLLARRKIPPEYRQKMRHQEPIRRFILAGIVCYLLAAMYGYSAAKEWVPKTRGIPLQMMKAQWHKQKENVCQKLSDFDWAKDYCTPQEISTQDAKLSHADKARAIQEKLQASGYHLSVDGIFGKKSKQAAKRYLKSNAISLPNNASLDDYYNAIVRDER